MISQLFYIYTVWCTLYSVQCTLFIIYSIQYKGNTSNRSSLVAILESNRTFVYFEYLNCLLGDIVGLN